MNRTRIKFCGMTRAEDVAAAVELGVDAVGFVCHPGSARFVPADRLAQLARAVPPYVTPVLLFVDAAGDDVLRALECVPDALLQFHGNESAVQCEAAGRPYVKAVAMGATVDLLDCERLFSSARALLADTPSGSFGGSGNTFDWGRVPAPGRRSRPLILAGGLHADNVGAAIAAVRPYAVDVSSGIEATRGIKDRERMARFVAAVRAAEA
jgi:phosphoribosylanthranilate isomerase